jgi:hypothetical protein
MSCSMTVDKHLTLTENNLVTRFSLSLSLSLSLSRWCRLNTIFARRLGNSTVLMRCHNYRDYVTVNGKLRYSIVHLSPPFDTDGPYEVQISKLLSHAVRMSAITSVFARLETNSPRCTARHINGPNSYFSMPSRNARNIHNCNGSQIVILW